MSSAVETSLTVRERSEENDKRFLHFGWNDNGLTVAESRTESKLIRVRKLSQDGIVPGGLEEFEKAAKDHDSTTVLCA